MNMYDFRYGKYMNRSGGFFSLRLVHEWGRFKGLKPHVRAQNHGKVTLVTKTGKRKSSQRWEKYLAIHEVKEEKHRQNLRHEEGYRQ